MNVLTNTDWEVSGPVSRHTAVGFVSMKIVARMTAEGHQQSTVTEKCPPIFQMPETTACLCSTHCQYWENDYLLLSDNTASITTMQRIKWTQSSTWSVDTDQNDHSCQKPHLNLCSGWNDDVQHWRIRRGRRWEEQGSTWRMKVGSMRGWTLRGGSRITIKWTNGRRKGRQERYCIHKTFLQIFLSFSIRGDTNILYFCSLK